jgi:hypothetical protein
MKSKINVYNNHRMAECNVEYINNRSWESRNTQCTLFDIEIFTGR